MSGKVAVDLAKFEAIVQKSGAPCTEQRGYLKVEPAPGRKLYVAKTKTVRRVDVSGTGLEKWGVGGVLDLGDQKFGEVRQQLDFSRTEDEVLAAFELTIEELRAMGPRAKQSKKKLPTLGELREMVAGMGYELTPIAGAATEVEEAPGARA